jgi:hypothetical protein
MLNNELVVSTCAYPFIKTSSDQPLKITRHLLSEQPKNGGLQSLLTRLNTKLAEAQAKEAEHQITNPLQYSIDLLALTEQELEMLVKIFEKIDVKQVGALTMKQVFEFIGQPLTPISQVVCIQSPQLTAYCCH